MAEKLRTLDFGDGKGARVLVPDWENVENKPFGEGIVPLVDNQTIPLDEGQGIIEMPTPLSEGKEYTVIYNGTEYKRTATLFTVEGMGTGITIGNTAILGGDDTGEPFTIVYSDGMHMIAALDGSEEIVLTIRGLGIKRIDKVYIQDNAVTLYVDSLYRDGINYIYKDRYFGEKLTLEELQYFIKNNTKILIECGTSYIYPVRLDADYEYGTITIINSSLPVEFYYLRTAEYTG